VHFKGLVALILPSEKLRHANRIEPHPDNVFTGGPQTKRLSTRDVRTRRVQAII
jgi:hypothetical protein